MKQPYLSPPLAFCHFRGHASLKHSRWNVQQNCYFGLQLEPRRICREHQQSSILLLSQVSSDGGDNNDSGGIEQTAKIPSESQEQQDPSLLFEIMSPKNAKPDQMSASSLAYLGDVVYELFVRSRYVWPSRRMSDLQNKVVSIVRAEAQSLLLQKFMATFPLTSTEQGVLARGRNANLTARKKGKSTNSGGGASAYQDSTAFEALLGYTYISDKQRFYEMISWINLEMDELDRT
mmetsp:Transcript_21729/g.37313  ORF Transcript_21729/g.37313 Transcript_21729/m.37313 type:complete len:234 (-) Transcript_21729:107-808(-)